MVTRAEPRHISATEARVHFGKVIEEIQAGSEPIVVEKSGEPVVIMLSPAEYYRLVKQDTDVWSRIELIRRDVAVHTGGASIGDADEMIDLGRE
jgi:prevent-host-death family protein